MAFSKHFKEAAIDYFFLVQKGYPPRGFLQLVGDRYELTNHERTMLYRGIAPENIAEMRKNKSVGMKEAEGKVLFIDGFNVILTISAYLRGLPLFLSTDGFLRDTSMLRGKIQTTGKIQESLDLIFDFIQKNNTGTVHFYLDQKVEIHHEIIQLIGEFPSSKSGKCKVLSSKQVDLDLSEIKSGIICTSDSGIIDKCRSPVFDLAFHVLQSCFHPQIPNLQTIPDEAD